jgi:hypothetical protein
MNRWTILWGLLLVGLSCGRDLATPPQSEQAGPSQQTATTGPELDAEDPTILRRPFTAEQIRDEMVLGFEARVRMWTPGGEEVTRWRVVEADPQSVGIEYVNLDGDGQPIGEPQVQRSDWVELRNHASFPADRATRVRAARQTALGNLYGWLYTVRDEKAGTVTEYFFADSLPGAPVHMRIISGTDVVMEMAQLERDRPQR